MSLTESYHLFRTEKINKIKEITGNEDDDCAFVDFLTFVTIADIIERNGTKRIDQFIKLIHG